MDNIKRIPYGMSDFEAIHCENEYYVDNCVECGSCAYSCPSKIPIVQYIKTAKKELSKMRKNK